MKQALRVIIGFVLVSIIWILSGYFLYFFGLLFTDGNNPIVVDDGFRNLKFIASLCAFSFSLLYFRQFENQRKTLRLFHLIVGVLLLGYFGNQYLQVRKDQREILTTYTEFRQALIHQDYQKAYDLMSPEWRSEHSVNDVWIETQGILNLESEDSLYSIHVYRARAEIVPDSRTTWWFRPSSGYSWGFEKIGTEWFVSPRNINFFLVPG